MAAKFKATEHENAFLPSKGQAQGLKNMDNSYLVNLVRMSSLAGMQMFYILLIIYFRILFKYPWSKA